MKQEQNNINNNELKVKYYRKTGQTEGMIGQITLYCSLGQISLNIFKDNEDIKVIRQGVIPTNEERKIINKYGEENITKQIIDYIETKSKIDEEKQFRYMLLDRLKQDCNYYLGYGNRQEKYLWAGNVKEQISKMKELYNSFAEDEKPEWLSMKDIEDYENKMKEKE